MNIKIIEKNKFSDLQSNFHKMLNKLDNKNINREQYLKLLEINKNIDILLSNIIDFNDTSIINNKKLNNKIKEIENDNRVINDLIPIAFIYRMLLKP